VATNGQKANRWGINAAGPDWRSFRFHHIPSNHLQRAHSRFPLRTGLFEVALLVQPSPPVYCLRVLHGGCKIAVHLGDPKCILFWVIDRETSSKKMNRMTRLGLVALSFETNRQKRNLERQQSGQIVI